MGCNFIVNFVKIYNIKAIQSFTFDETACIFS